MFKKYFWIISIISFIIGLFLVHYLSVVKTISPFLYFSISLFSFLILFKFKKIIFLILFFVFLAIWRYQLIFLKDASGYIENYLGEDFSIIGKIIFEPEIKNNKQKIKLKIYGGRDENNFCFKLKGKILIYTLAYPIYYYGDFLEINGEYLKPEKINNFDYNLYLKRFGITTISYYPQIKKIDNFSNLKDCQFLKKDFFSNLSFLFKINIYKFKNKISSQFDFYLSYHSSAILKAMLLGDKSSLDQKSLDFFSRAGLSHIIAISGMHINLLSSLLLNFLLFIGISRKKSFYFSVLFLMFYLILIGAPASACRASLMGFLSFLAIYTGRSGNLINVLFFSAIFLLLINPLLIFADIGFQLSFLAVLGIIYFHPIVKEFLQIKVFKKISINDAIVDILSITISVQLISGPVLISSFNQLSLISPISNLLVVWLLPIIISTSIISLIISFFLSFFGGLLYFFIDLLLRYILSIATLVNKIPWAFVDIDNWSIYFTIIYYLILIYIFRKRFLKK